MPIVNTRDLRLYVDGVDVSDAVSEARFSAKKSDSDWLSFAMAAAGGATDWTLKLKLAQDTDADSLYDQLWTAPGATVPVVLWPNGRPVSGTASAAQPSFTASVIVSWPDGDVLGGEADASATARMVAEVEWSCLAQPVKAIS